MTVGRRSDHPFIQERVYPGTGEIAEHGAPGAVGPVGTGPVPRARQPDRHRTGGRPVTATSPLERLANPWGLLAALVAARHHPCGPVLGGELVDHPDDLRRQREFRQRLGQLARGYVDVPGASIGVGTYAVATDVGEHAILVQDTPGQLQQHRGFGEAGEDRGTGRQLMEVHRTAAVLDCRPVKEVLQHLCDRQGERRIVVLVAGMPYQAHDAAVLLLGTGRVGAAEESFDLHVLRDRAESPGSQGSFSTCSISRSVSACSSASSASSSRPSTTVYPDSLSSYRWRSTSIESIMLAFFWEGRRFREIRPGRASCWNKIDSLV